MSLETQIMTDLKTAMLAKDEAALRGLRAIKSALLIAKTSGAGGELKPEDEIKIVQKLVKQRKESLEIYEQQNRPDLAKAEQEEITVIEKFLPQMMSENDVKSAIQSIIQQTGSTTLADLGKVMGAATKQLSGKADNKMVATLVKQLLS